MSESITWSFNSVSDVASVVSMLAEKGETFELGTSGLTIKTDMTVWIGGKSPNFIVKSMYETKNTAPDGLGDRMKGNYEGRQRMYLTRRTPVIMRLDGKAFHTLLHKAEKPFDMKVISAMQRTAAVLLHEVQGAKCAYIQSDEISILITDFDKLTTAAWFDYNIQKMVSVAAGIASVSFTQFYGQRGIFDARVFNIPKEEVINYFRWRYKDWLRNSIQALAQSMFSPKQLHGKKTADMQEMCFQAGRNWNDCKAVEKNGTFIPIIKTEAVGELWTIINMMKDDDPTNIFINSVLYPPPEKEE